MKVTELNARVLKLSGFTVLVLALGQSVFSQQEAAAPVAPPAGASEHPAATAQVVPTSNQEKMKVVFDDANPGVVYVESNGERIRVDVNKKTVEPATATTAAVGVAPIVTAPAAAPAEPPEESAYSFDKGEEPYDARLINVPTPKKVPKHTWNLDFTHRFSQPIHPIDESARNLFGLDSFAIASFGLRYGITDKLFASVYRSPLCQKGVCRVIEIGIGYNFLEHDQDSPIAVQGYASIEGNGNFTEEYNYNFQARISARLGKRVYLFFSPGLHLNSNGQDRFNPRPTDYFPPAQIANSVDLGRHTVSFGFGTSVMITPSVLALFEFTPRIGFKLGQTTAILDNNFNVIGFDHQSYPEIGFGLQKNIGKHSFTITFSNTQTTTTSRYNSSNLVLKPQRLVLGFNLSRRF